MDIIILVAWLVQAAVGVTLLVRWARHARRSGARPVVTHVVVVAACLVGWVVFVLTANALWAWLAVTGLCIGIPFGETQMVARSRRIRGERSPGMRDYTRAIGTVFSGRMPAKVAFHALFSGVVFFGSLGVAIGATVAG